MGGSSLRVIKRADLLKFAFRTSILRTKRWVVRWVYRCFWGANFACIFWFEYLKYSWGADCSETCETEEELELERESSEV